MSSKSPFSKFNNPAPSEYDVDREDDFGDRINLPDTHIDYAGLDKTARGVEKAPLKQVVDNSPHISLSRGKYAGKRSSRKEIEEAEILGVDEEEDEDEEAEQGDDEGLIWRFGENEQDDSEEEQSEQDVADQDDEMDEDDEQDVQDEQDEHSGGQDSDAHESATGQSDNEEVDEDNGDEEVDGEVDGEEGLDGSTAQSQKEEMTKAIHTKNQLQMWDDIMSMRILLQPELTRAVQFPQLNDYNLYTQDPSIKSEFAEITGEVSNTLDNLVTLQEQLLVSDKPNTEKNTKKRTRDQRSCEEWWETLQTLNNSVIDHCGNILDKWSGRMQVSSGKVSSKKFQSFNQGFMTQVEALFSDRERLIKRTTHVKKGVTIFGKQNQQEYDDEIFDDTDFYQNLLKDLIANGSVGSGNSQDNWKEMSAVKKTRQDKDPRLGHASKGRLANYDVQEKLVHFMAPDDRPLQCDWNLDELFANLFGGLGKRSSKNGS